MEGRWGTAGYLGIFDLEKNHLYHRVLSMPQKGLGQGPRGTMTINSIHLTGSRTPMRPASRQVCEGLPG